MKIHLIAVHRLNNNITGFRLLDSDNGQVLDQPYNSVLQVVVSGRAKIKGIKYNKSKNELVGSNGSFDRYPTIKNNVLVNNSIIIINSIDEIGYRISDSNGNCAEYNILDTIALAKGRGIANGKIVKNGDKEHISAISGNYDNVKFNGQIQLPVQTSVQTPVNNNVQSVPSEGLKKPVERISKNNDNNKEHAKDYAKKLVERQNKNKLFKTGHDPRIPKLISGVTPKNSKLKELDAVSGMTVDQKMVYCMLAMKSIKPFYYSIFNVLKRLESNEIETMGVTIDTLYFSSDFVLEKELPFLLFVFHHEVCHIAMKHRIRENGRDHEIWNIACDYYINKHLADEFGLHNLGDITDVSSAIRGESKRYKVGLPDDCYYNDTIDISKDTPERIYDELMKNLNNQNKNNNNQNSDDKQNSDNQDKDNKTKNNINNQNGDNKNQNSDDQNNNNQDSQSQNGQNKSRLQGVKFRGQDINTENQPDMIDDGHTKNANASRLEQESKSLLNRAVTMHKQSHTFGGEAGDFLERLVERELAPKINWKSVLKNKLTFASKKINTFSAPDKRFRARGMIMPGPKKLENDSLENVKVCIDTSGSITDKDLGIALAQIEQMLRVYKAKAEVIYWDTQVRKVEQFENVKELLAIKPAGGGGTDANCVFSLFENSKEYKKGKPKPSIIIIFTDGYFGEIEKRYKKYKDTIWVIHDNNSFVAPFGVAAPMKMD